MDFDFTFKRFGLTHAQCGMKIGTDGVLLGAWTDCSSALSVLDVGCGCGLIAMMIAQRCPDAEITAIDIDKGAVADSSLNVSLSPWAGRIDVQQADFAQYQPGRTFDLIVSNPPFFATGEHSADIARSSARHEGALSAASLIRFAVAHLSPCGSLAMITPTEAYDQILFDSTMHRLYPRRITQVFSAITKPKPIRTLWQLSMVDGPCHRDNICIRDAHGRYTEEFARLTRDFYLNL